MSDTPQPLPTSTPNPTYVKTMQPKELAVKLYNAYARAFQQPLPLFTDLTDHCKICWIETAKEALKY